MTTSCMLTSRAERDKLQQMDRGALAEYQVTRLNQMLESILPANPMYARKLAGQQLPVRNLEELIEWPFTSKAELQPGEGQLLPRNMTYDISRYVRFHQTSGTRGRPLMVVDTQEDWQWWIESWQSVLDAAELEDTDRALLAFSFGPFIGFWSAFDALTARRAMTIPAGGMSSLARLELARRSEATCLFCTPSYALHLAEVAREHQIRVDQLPIKKIVVAGEPGGSVAATRARIESSWQVSLFDHAGASEVGPWGVPDRSGTGLHVLESEFIAEFIGVESGQPANEGEVAHLVLTSLGRYGSPVIRYRTGDLVRPVWPKEGRNRFVLLDGGVLGRADDMLIIRGVNIFPSSIEQILHSFPEVVEYRITARKSGQLDQLEIDVEDHLEQPERIAEELLLKLGLKISVSCVPSGSLPRSEGKSQRFVDLRES